ncbi:MAG: hypothetical protein ACJ8M1_00895 [Chthoniobacterales bacterium]
MHIPIKRLIALITAALVTGAAQPSLRADIPFSLDPDGSGNSPAINPITFQFGAGNSLFGGSIPFTQGDTFQLLFHAQLNSVVLANGTQVTPIGLNASGAVGGVTPFEITLVGSVTENVTNVNNTPARIAYRVAGTQSTASFIEMYFDASQNANPLAGTGYNDGKLILRGAPVPPNPDVGTFALSNPQPTNAPSFDLFGNNDYANVTSIQGVGATRMDVSVTFVDTAFFVAGNGTHKVKVGDLITLDLSHSSPFDKVDPSHLFVTAPNSGTGSGPAASGVPRIGATNGAANVDFQTQTLIAATVRATNSSPTPTPGGSPTPTPTPTATPTATPVGSPTPTPTATPTPTGLRVSVSANKTQVREGGDVIITFTVRGGTNHGPLTVNYSVGGNATLNTDFTLSGTPGHVVIPANAFAASITMHAIADTVSEPNGEAVKIFVEPGSFYDVPTQLDAKRVSILIQDR